MNKISKKSDISWLAGAKILVTGAAGTVGRELVKQLCQNSSVKIIGIDQNENEIFALSEAYRNYDYVNHFVADVRHMGGLERHFFDVDYVFHTAALKHVILGEWAPDQVVATNVIGVQNVISLCKKFPVKKLIFTSSDKAVGPTNVMGASKLMGERLIAAEYRENKQNHCRFISTRFGNVLGSAGSVFDIFVASIQAGRKLTITDTEMTRYMMSIEDAVALVIESARIGRGGEIFVARMPIIRIVDLAKAVSQIIKPGAELDFEIIGKKSGEKLYEELMTPSEAKFALESEDFFVVPGEGRNLRTTDYPGFNEIGSNSEGWGASQQGPFISVEEIIHLIEKSDLLNSISRA